MSHSFASLYLDEDVDILIARLIRARGFAVLTTQEAGNLGVDDAAQFAYAVSIGSVFLTHNRADFDKLARQYLEEGKTHYGLIIAIRRPAYEIARRLLRLLSQVKADELINQIRYI